MKRDGKVYRLAQGRTPLNFLLQVKDKRSKSLLYYDEEKKEQRALRYAPNQRSIFMDEQDDNARLGLIIFKDGSLFVGNREPLLQKFLEHHPGNTSNKGGTFFEVDHRAENNRVIETLDAELEAQVIARELSLKGMENLIRKIKPSEVDKMDSSEIKRDVKVLAKNDPYKFMSLVEVESGDDSVMSVISQAVEERVIQFRPKNGEVFWTTDENKKRLFKAPEGEDLESSLVTFLMSNEGIEIYKEIESNL